ncbi:LysR family transcriptional regulator [Prauserella cavernicola]|uniref:LysR family transcriptional regulator n=1 Tax=Prauserella cavernicola TaxID=2800127 RepID=A0A934QM39_9PSEU|nr:LysR family transcriptional regulator [Prauserella cavernicola]MBK1782811.1 LysR family transcriptional regulator [Prauserella cavernicola]
MTIELRHFHCFLAIAGERNLTRAAAVLHLTQPAVSRTLRQLEQRLGVRLVDRSTHHLTLTAQGEAFRERAAAVVTAVDRALDPTLLGHAPLRLGHAWSALGQATPILLRRWEHDHPATPLELHRVDERTAGLRTGLVDAALLRGPVAEGGLVTRLLGTEPRVAAVPTGSALAARSSLTLADLSGEPVVVNTVSGLTTPELWPPRIRPARLVPVANTDDWLAAIAAGRGVGVTSTATARVHAYPGVEFVPVTDAEPIPVVLAWPRAGGHPAVPALVELARELLA